MTMHDDTPADASAGIVRATRRGRLLTAALVVCMIVLVAFFQLFVFPLLKDALGANPSAQAVRTLKWIFAGCAAFGMLPALYMTITGSKVRRCGQFPLPGAWVWRDTGVRRGRDAERIGALCIASGAVACLLCIGTAVYIWITFDRLAPGRLRPGVVIIQPAPAPKP